MTHGKPFPIRFEEVLLRILEEGVRRTPHKKQELVRLTLRRYLPKVIEEESVAKKPREGWEKSLVKIKSTPLTKEEKSWLDAPNDFDQKDWQW